MIVRRADLALTGETAGYASPANSGTPVRRRFCPRCGTPLLAEAPDAPDLLLPRARALDDPERARPERTIWTGSGPSWGLIDPALPGCEGQP